MRLENIRRNNAFFQELNLSQVIQLSLLVNVSCPVKPVNIIKGQFVCTNSQVIERRMVTVASLKVVENVDRYTLRKLVALNSLSF